MNTHFASSAESQRDVFAFRRRPPLMLQPRRLILRGDRSEIPGEYPMKKAWNFCGVEHWWLAAHMGNEKSKNPINRL
jgi:hypothetical protein